jgi:hypothetical protein
MNNKDRISGNAMPNDKTVDRRKFIEKSARDVGTYGFAIYDIVKAIKTEIVQGVVDEIKDTIKGL